MFCQEDFIYRGIGMEDPLKIKLKLVLMRMQIDGDTVIYFGYIVKEISFPSVCTVSVDIEEAGWCANSAMSRVPIMNASSETIRHFPTFNEKALHKMDSMTIRFACLFKVFH